MCIFIVILIKNMTEEWLPVKNHPDYLISSLGNVKSPNQMLKINTTKVYPSITIQKTQYLVHRLVAQTFLPNPENKLEVNHKDNNTRNFNVDNLEWVTRSENMSVNRRSYHPATRKAQPVNIIKGEIWKDALGVEAQFSVSNLGRVIKKTFTYTYGDKGYKTTVPDQIMVLHLTRDGYTTVVGKKNGKPQNWRVHRLVAQTFLPNPENKPMVNHINGIKDDNRLENLEWCTASENATHAVETGLTKIIPYNETTEYATRGAVALDMWKDALTQKYSKHELARKYDVGIGFMRSIFNRKFYTEFTCNLPDPIFKSMKSPAIYKRSIKYIKVPDEINEHWGRIDGYKYRYYASNLGRFKVIKINKPNTKREILVKEFLLSMSKSPLGMEIRGTTKKGTETTILVHRFVANFFTPNPNNWKYVGWIDGDKTNCKWDNLIWHEKSNEGEILITELINPIGEDHRAGMWFKLIMSKYGMKDSLCGRYITQYYKTHPEFERRFGKMRSEKPAHIPKPKVLPIPNKSFIPKPHKPQRKYSTYKYVKLKYVLPEEVMNEIYNRYLNGEDLTSIAKSFNVSSYIVKKNIAIVDNMKQKKF